MLPLLGPAMTNTLQRWRDNSFQFGQFGHGISTVKSRKIVRSWKVRLFSPLVQIMSLGMGFTFHWFPLSSIGSKKNASWKKPFPKLQISRLVPSSDCCSLYHMNSCSTYIECWRLPCFYSSVGTWGTWSCQATFIHDINLSHISSMALVSYIDSIQTHVPQKKTASIFIAPSYPEKKTCNVYF